MDTTTVAAPARETVAHKALRLFPERTIEPLGHGRYSVEGTDCYYEVDLKPFGGTEACNCPATKPCYHLCMATIFRAKSRAALRRSARPKFNPDALADSLEAIDTAPISIRKMGA